MDIRNLWQQVKRNHALEHATIALLVERGNKEVLAGNATAGGFYIYGDLSTDHMTQAVGEAIERLRQGERQLAISPFCGTNLVVAALLTGVGSAIVLGQRERWRRLPLVMATTLSALLAARPLGALAQQHLTTDADLEAVTVTGITRRGKGRHTVHQVSTTQEHP